MTSSLSISNIFRRMAGLLAFVLLLACACAADEKPTTAPEPSQQTAPATSATTPATEAPAPAAPAAPPAAEPAPPAAAPAAPATQSPAAMTRVNDGPTVVVAVGIRNRDLAVADMKYRVMFLKTERKFIPVPGYDFAGAVQAEIMDFLAKDKRANYRLAVSEDKLDASRMVESKSPGIPASFQEDRVLAISIAEYGAFVSGFHKWLHAFGGVKLIDGHTGQELWKHGVYERVKFKGASFEEIQADNQKGLRTMLNELQEKVTSKLTEKISKSRM